MHSWVDDDLWVTRPNTITTFYDNNMLFYMAVNSPVDPKQSPAATEAGEAEGTELVGWPWASEDSRFSSLSSICKLLDMARRLLSISSSFRS